MTRFLYTGDRGSGKTTALVLRLCALLDKGVAPEKIQVLTGHRYRHQQQFKERLMQYRLRPVTGLRLHTHPYLARHILETFSHLTPYENPVLLNHQDMLMLLHHEYTTRGDTFFPGHHPSPQFFQHLLRRHQRCAQHLLWDDALKQRTAALETDPMAMQANAFLTAFSEGLQNRRPALLDSRAQARTLHHLVQIPEVQAHFNARYWLIDDLEETHPLDQFVLEQLSKNSERCIATANPYGGLDMGANPEYVNRFAAAPCEIQELIQHQPLGNLARKMYACIQHLPYLEDEDTADLQEVSHHQHTGQMYEAMGAQIERLLQQGTPAHDIVCTTWYLDALSARQLHNHFHHRGIPVDILQSQQGLQRSPLVNTLLSLLRLVFWAYFHKQPDIPRLTGLDMAQIFRICGGLDAFEVSELRFQCKDRLEAWGKQLQQAPEGSRLYELQQGIQQLRSQYDNPDITDFYGALHTLWQKHFLPFLEIPLTDTPQQPEAHTLPREAFGHVQQLFERLVRQIELNPSLEEAHTRSFWAQIFHQQLQVYAPTPPRENGRVKVMTTYRLCEQRQSYGYQLWFDLSSSAWFRPLNHPIDNVLLLSQRWPLDRPWDMRAEEEHIEERLARCWRKGLLYCEQAAYFYGCLYDTRAQMQRSEQLAYWLQHP